MSLASSAPPSRSLGMYTSSPTFTLSINAFTLTLTQSPSHLRSSHASGTTGAVLWSITPALARYLTLPSCPLLKSVFTPTSLVLELGCGVASVLSSTLGTLVATYIQSDMPTLTRLAAQNLRENLPSPRKGKKQRWRVETIPLDWEVDDVASQPVLRGLAAPLDAIIASDCVYNEALVPPLVDTLVAACLLNRGQEEGEGKEKTLVLIAQEVRSPDVMEFFLDALMARFDVWRVPDALLSDELGPERGYVLHVGVLRDGR